MPPSGALRTTGLLGSLFPPADQSMSDFKFTLHTPKDIQKWPDPEWIIEDILPKDSSAEIIGKWGSGKTFIALDWGLSIAAGIPWGGKHKVKQGTVLYVFGEGKSGVKQRINAWFDHYGVDPEGVPFMAVDMPLQLASMDDLNKFIEDVNAQSTDEDDSIQLIIFDTLARCIVGVDENTAVGMGIVMNSLDYLRRLSGATTLIVHHTGHGKTDRGRGSSAVPASLDTSILTTKKPKSRVVKVECKKIKDGDEFHDIAVTLVDSRKKTKEGKAVTLVSVLGGEVPVEDPVEALSRSRNQRTLLRFMVEERPLGVTYKDLRAAKIIKDGSFHPTLTKLTEMGLVANNGPWYHPTDEASKVLARKDFN